MYITKPSMSRTSNSEKYIVCSEFKGISEETKEILKTHFNNPEELKLTIPKSFLDEVNKYNELFVSLQVDTIQKITQTIGKYKTIYPTQKHIQSAKRWCELYKVPINKECIYF